MLRESSRVLLIRLDRLGDVVLSTPAIAAVRAVYPRAHIAMMVRPACREAVEGLPGLDAVILYDKDDQHRSAWQTVQFAWSLRGRFDVALVLHPSNRSHWIAWLAGIPTRVGWDRKSGWLLTHRVPHAKHEGAKHEADYTLDIVRAAGIAVTRRPPLAFPSRPAASARVAAWLAERGVRAGERLVVIHPSASCVSKRWMPERFAAVADQLSHDGARVVVVTGPEDRAYGAAMLRACHEPLLDACGVFSVGELGELLRRATLLISNDSGPVHIAVAVGAPVVDIFGRNQAGLSPLRWGPLGAHDQVLHKEVGCTVCLAHNCDIAFKCLTEISVPEVLSAANVVLTSTKAVPVNHA